MILVTTLTFCILFNTPALGNIRVCLDKLEAAGFGLCTSCCDQSAVLCRSVCVLVGMAGNTLRVLCSLCIRCLLFALSSVLLMNEWVGEERAGLGWLLHRWAIKSTGAGTQSPPPFLRRFTDSLAHNWEEDSFTSSLSRSKEKGSFVFFTLQAKPLCINSANRWVSFLSINSWKQVNFPSLSRSHPWRGGNTVF